MISFNKKSQNTKFYFSQEFRNRQIKTIYNILKLPITNENNIFINQLLINNNNDLYNFYFPKKPFYINNKDFLSRLGNKGIVETSNQIIELLKQKEKQEQEKLKELQEKSKSLNEELTRPKFSSLDYSDEKDPDEILSEKIKERKLLDNSKFKNHKTLEEVGLVPVQIKKRGKNKTYQIPQVQQDQNHQDFPLVQNDHDFKENEISNFENKQEKNQNLQPLKEKNIDKADLEYHNDDFKIEKPLGKIDFSMPISKELLMENVNEGMEDTNYTVLTKDIKRYDKNPNDQINK